MKSIRVLYLLALFVIILLKNIAIAADSNFAIKEWKEYARITPTGKVSTAIITGVPQNLAAGFMLKSYSIGFPRERRIKLLEAKIDGKPAKFSFEKNLLSIDFNRGKNNRETVEISFSYEEINIKANQGIRYEAISIPNIASGADFFVAFDYGESMEIISGEDNLVLKNGVAVYRGIAPNDGLLKILKFTNKRDGWNVKIDNTISFNNLSGEMEVTLPNLFENGGQKILDSSFISSPRPENSREENGFRILNFKVSPDFNKIVIQSKAKILTGESFRSKVSNNGNDSMTYVPESDAQILAPILASIKGNLQYEGLPMHVKITKFVNGFLKYDRSIYGKTLNVRDILKEKKGVCIEFATLYRDLARLAGIPSSIVYGYALGEYEKFEPHAWNMSKIGDSWVQIDPTWNLSSGSVSSSHIYLKNNSAEDIVVKFRGDGDGPGIKLEKIIDIKSMRESDK